MEDQTDMENERNALRQRKNKGYGTPNKGMSFDGAKERLVTPPLPPSNVMKALSGALRTSSAIPRSQMGSANGSTASTTPGE